MINWTSQRMRGIAVIAALAVLGLVLSLVPWRVGEGPMRTEAERRIRMALNAPDATIGAMSLTLLPTPRLQVDSLSFTRADGSLSGMAQSASVAIKMDPLVRGVAKPTGLLLVRPIVTVRTPGAGGTVLEQAAAVRKAIADVLVASESLNGLNEIAIEDGRLHLAGPSGSATIEAVRLLASVVSPSKPLKVIASGRHGGVDLRLSFAGASPKALASGAVEPVSASYSAGRNTIEFRGEGSLAGDVHIRGDLSGTVGEGAALPGASALASLGMPLPPGSSLRAKLDMAGSTATLRDLSVLSDRWRFDGVGALRHDGQRWHVNATLATPSADLSPLFANLAGVRSLDGGWSRKTFDLEPLFGLNLDLRISADRATAGAHVLSRVGMAMISRQNRIEASVSDAAYNGGRVRARLIVTRGSDSLEHKLTASLDAVDIGALAAATGLPARFTGTGTAEVALDAAGDSAAKIIANLDGKLSISARSGDILGIDLNRLALRRAARPDLLLADALGGRTAFESAVLTARVNRGQIAPIEGTMQANRLVGTLTGEVDIARDDIRLTGNVVQLKIEPGLIEPMPVIDFSVTGPLAEPRMTPNIAALLKRS